MRLRLALPVLLAVCVVAPGVVADPEPLLHEQIPPDAREDMQLAAVVEGEIPAALETRSGTVTAPDPRRPIPPRDSSAPQPPPANEQETYKPDKDTRRPDVQGYEEPFTPSTAPFKRLEAFDTVGPSYELRVGDKTLTVVPLNANVAPDGSEDQFYADLLVDVAPGKHVRIPSVGPGARIVHARLGVGGTEMKMRVLRDGADNWFVESFGPPARARLVMELTIPRGVFGGEYADASWSELPRLAAPFPEAIRASAREVQQALGVAREMRPREVVAKLVAYFRSFVESEEPPRGRRDIYLDLALSKKGVCRHRAFAFMVTAQSLGIPARMIINEAHAWVEAHDGQMWRRLDLGGAGRMTNPASNALPDRQAHKAPPDPFQWPTGAQRGEDMVAAAREAAQRERDANGNGNGASASASGASSVSADPPPSVPTPSPTATSGKAHDPGARPDERPTSSISVFAPETQAHRGAPLVVKGEVKAEGEACPHVMVELYLRNTKRPGPDLALGAVPTNDAGEYAGSIIVPGAIPLGDYELVAKTAGDTRCGKGDSP